MELIVRLSLVTVLVRDEEEALHWYTDVLGLQKRADAVYGPGVRWLTVAPKDQHELEIVLQKPSPALHGEERAKLMMEQIGQGTTWVFRTENCMEAYDTLRNRGVTFVTPPKKEPWGGVQAVFTDLYGNRFALIGPK